LVTLTFQTKVTPLAGSVGLFIALCAMAAAAWLRPRSNIDAKNFLIHTHVYCFFLLWSNQIEKSFDELLEEFDKTVQATERRKDFSTSNDQKVIHCRLMLFICRLLLLF